jgi:hypothetical protein
LPPRLTRLLVLGAALLFVIGFAYLTFASIVEQHGITLGGLLSILVVVLLAVGIVGALRHPPQ